MNLLHHLAHQADEDCPLEYCSVHLTDAILDALRTHLVLFSRDVTDPCTVPPTTPATPPTVHAAHLGTELADPSLNLTLLTAIITHDGNSIVLLCTVMHDGDRASLAQRLQTLYDDNGVAGWFEVAP